MLTPEQRLEIYEKMLPYFNMEERLPFCGSKFAKCIGFCDVARTLCYFGVSKVRHIDYFPELLSKRPDNKRVDGYWFQYIEAGIDYNRTEVLTQCITEVKLLIHDTIPY